MNKYLYLYIILFSLLLASRDFNIFTKIETNIIKDKQKQREIESDILKNSWINPLFLKYSISNYKDQTIPNRIKTTATSISINQPIFKSGGIFHTREKAKILLKLSDIKSKSEKITILSKIYELAINLNKIDLNLKKNQILIENLKLDIKQKEDLYLNGLLDTIYLDEVVISLTILENKTLNLQENKLNILQEFNKISQVKYYNIIFKDLNRSILANFIKQNINILITTLNRNILKIDEKNYKSNYLPQISIYGQYGYKKKDIGVTNGSLYSYGVNLNIPFSLNNLKKKDLANTKYLISQNIVLETRQYEINFLELQRKILSICDKRIKNTRDSIVRFESIYKTTKDLYKSSLRTKNDLTIVTNRLKSIKLEILILEMDKKLILNKIFKRRI